MQKNWETEVSQVVQLMIVMLQRVSLLPPFCDLTAPLIHRLAAISQRPIHLLLLLFVVRMLAHPYSPSSSTGLIGNPRAFEMDES